MTRRTDLPRAALSALGVGLIEVNDAGCVTGMNRFSEKMTGWDLDVAMGRSVGAIFSLIEEGGAERRTLRQRVAEMDFEGPIREEGTLVRRDGQRFPIELSVTRSETKTRGGTGMVVVFTDVSESHLMAHQMARMSNLDLLTGLLNRRAFSEHLAAAIEGCGEKGERHVVCFFDIDQFKLVNDTCGHDAGDDLLHWVAAVLRETAGERDTVARFGGDEFVILMVHKSVEEGMRVVEDVQRRMSEFSFTWGNKSFQITAATGVAAVTSARMTPAQILSAADHACYLAKDKGRGGVRVFEFGESESADHLEDMNLVARIHRRLRDGSTMLYAQEIRRISPGPSDGLQFEVLLRFEGVDGRLEEPGKTIGATERYGLMPVVDRWVIRTALEHLSSLGPERLSLIDVCFINLSGLSLQDDTVLDYIRAQLSDSGVPPHKVGFEITETTAVQNLQQAQWFIQELRSIGCRLALDDFGTGAASYSYLKSLPVQYLKIDGGFVESMVSSKLDLAMVESINQIAHVLGIETVAESVSSEELLGKVQKIGIDHAQGFWIARPKPMLDVCRQVG